MSYYSEVGSGLKNTDSIFNSYAVEYIGYIIVALPFFVLLFNLSKKVTEKLFNKIYQGNYLMHSIAVSVSSATGMIILYALDETYINFVVPYKIFGLTGDYFYYIIPSLVIFLVTDIFVRTTIYKNNILFSIFNAIFVIVPPIILIYIIESISFF